MAEPRYADLAAMVVAELEKKPVPPTPEVIDLLLRAAEIARKERLDS